MQSRTGTKRQSHRRAAMLVQGAIFGSAVGVGVAALAIDTGLMYTAKQEMRTAADAAALAAASQLGDPANGGTLAGLEAQLFAGLNEIAGLDASLNLEHDIVYGHAVLNGEKFEFQPNVLPLDSARVTLRRDSTVTDGPVSLFFAKLMGMGGANLEASATAMLGPRDISLVIDLSASMNDDSELRHYTDFPSEGGGTGDGVQINLEDVWLALPIGKGNAGVGNGDDPPPAGNPNSHNDQVGTGPGAPLNAGGNACPGASGHEDHVDEYGPRWGWMTEWGDPIVLGVYDPVTDIGLYHIPRYATCNDADVAENMVTTGYTQSERNALLIPTADSDSTVYKNRVKVLLGLAGWRSKMMSAPSVKDSKYTGGPGNGDNVVDTNELCAEAAYPFDSGSWDDYIDFVRGSSQMRNTDGDLRFRYGIKTVTNYLLEKKPRNNETPELADTPEEPLDSVKNAVQTMVDEIVDQESDDHLAVETFAQLGAHRLDLTDVLQDAADTLDTYQAGHVTTYTNIGGGLQEGIDELTSVRSRSFASKIIIMLTDGKPNINEYDTYVGNNHAEAIAWVENSADEAKELGITIYAIGVGGDANTDLCEDIASSPDHYFFADNSPDPDNGGQPMYVTQLQEIFRALGDRRPVRLIE